ncbi:hypothetical protein EV174_002612 [Coemansia sp. RSA 2320]|nr:hypothetical protein EV174_002612 [Coemansia sp. RSA 2320]
MDPHGTRLEVNESHSCGMVVHVGLTSEDGTLDCDLTETGERLLFGSVSQTPQVFDEKLVVMFRSLIRFRRRSLVTYPRHMGAIVVLCSFAALALGPGLLNAYGVYEEEYDRLYDDKDEGGGQSSALGSPVIFIGILQILLANGMGFVGGWCAQRFGPGPTVFAGGLLMSLGLFLASYARHVWQLCLAQGVVFGLGVGLAWIPAASAPSSWFDRNRGVATGITHMGLGIGGLMFAPLSRFLLEKAGTSGSLRWLALVMLVGVSVASLGIHSKSHRPQHVNEIVVDSARWSKCLEDEMLHMPATGYDSDPDIDYPEYRRRSSLITSTKAAVDPADEEKDAETGGSRRAAKLPAQELGGDGDAEEISEIAAASPPPSIHVRFASNVDSYAVPTAKQAALSQLEGLTRGKVLGMARQKQAEKQAKRKKTMRVATDSKPPAKDALEGGTPSRRSIFRSWRFWLLSAGVGLGQAGWYVVLLFMTSISVSAGLGVHNAAIILGAINGASAVGQFTAGYAADVIGPINALLGFTLLATVSQCVLFVPHLSFHLLVAYACLCGASIGAADPLAVMASVTQFGRARAASTTGSVYGSVGVFVTVMAPSARVVLQRLGHNSANFTPLYVFVVLLFAASTLMLALLRLRISRRVLVSA